MTYLPNTLTLLRFALAPLIAWLAFDGRPLTALVLFLIAAFLDFADGWLARRLDAESELGRILDPAADKALIALTLLGLAAAGTLSGLHLIPAIAIVGRDALIPALRERAAKAGGGVPVSILAKWKTAAEMAALSILLLTLAAPLIAHPDTRLGLYLGGWATFAGLALLWIAAILSIVTGWIYARRAWSLLQ